MLNAMMIKRVKTLQREAGLDEEQYRAMLGGYGVESCKDLTPMQASSVISFLQGMAGGGTKARRPVSGKPMRYDELGGRSAEWATAKQLRMLEAMWVDVSRKKTRADAQEAFRVFLLHRWQVTGLEMLRRDQVSAVRRALVAMRERS